MNKKPDNPEDAAEVSLLVHPLGTRTIPEFNMIPALREVGSLLSLAQCGENLGPCSPRVLIRSAVVLLAACWEAYVEDILTQGFDFLIHQVPSANRLPKRLRQLVAKAVAKDKNELKMWDLADAGWKDELAAHAAQMLKLYVGRFNTPKAQNIQDIFRDVLGMSDVTLNWGGFDDYTRDEARQRLDEFVSARGAIAHGDPDATEVSAGILGRFILLVVNLSIITSTAVRKHIQEVTDKDMVERYAGQKAIFYKDPDTGREYTLVFEIEEGR
jgi:hypothetical protein